MEGKYPFLGEIYIQIKNYFYFFLLLSLLTIPCYVLEDPELVPYPKAEFIYKDAKTIKKTSEQTVGSF